MLSGTLGGASTSLEGMNILIQILVHKNEDF